MARNIRLTPYDEQMIDAFDQDASGPQYSGYGSSAPSTPTKSYFPPDDSVPLFLSDDPEASRRRGFGSGGGGNQERTVWPRILKVGIFAASAAAIAFAVVSVENPLALFANAKASLNGPSPGQAGTPVKTASEPAGPVRLASAEPAAAPIQPTVASRTSSPVATPAATSTPTRDEIAAALRNAHQSQPEIRQPPAVATVAAAQPVAASPAAVRPAAVRPAAASPPAPVAEDMTPKGAINRLDPNEIASSLTRANALIASGDLAAARLVLRRAADSGDARSAMMLAETYDPTILAKLGVRGVMPDSAMARGWYEKAKEFGAAEATQRLELLASKEH